MASIKVNKQALLNSISKHFAKEDKAITSIARETANKKFMIAKNATLRAFNSHQVTKEIEAGPNADGGIIGRGNLFSFLGFDYGATPIENLRTFLQDSVQMQAIPTYNGRIKRYYFKVYAPDSDNIADATRDDLDWGTFDSWVYALEEGVDNLNNYLFSTRRAPIPGSRSTTGLQTKKPLASNGGSVQVEYMTPILQILQEYIE